MSPFKRAFLSIFFFVLAVVGVTSLKHVMAGNAESALGWMWGGMDAVSGGNTALGWLSANSRNCDVNGDGTVDVATCPAGAIPNYGVNIPAASGSLSGYAWSENYGWLSFNAADIAGCPLGSCSAARNGNVLTGWARVLSIRDAGANSGGWSGFVSLDSATTGSILPYGVTIAGTILSGYAWSDELGWIDFSGVSISPAQTLKICENSCTSSFRRDTGALASFSMNTGPAYSKILYACLGTGSCSGDDVAVPATWGEVSSGAFIDAFDRSPDTNPQLSVTLTGKVVGSEKLTATSGIYSAEAVASVSCGVIIPACKESDEALATCVGQSYDMPYINNCTGVSAVVSCPGVRFCDSSWREVAP